MKREIKFRAWDVKNQQMIAPTESGFSIEMYLDGSFAVMQLNEDNGKWYDREGDDFELMQYTGMKDKNGVEVYEGDIVHNSNRTSLTLSDDDKLYVVEWQEGEYKQTENGSDWLCNKPGFIFRKLHRGMELIFSQHQIEVVGNIFENPNLL